MTSVDSTAMETRLALLLIEEAAKKQRSKTYTQILPRIGFASEFNSAGRMKLTSALLPAIGRKCFLHGVPFLSSLAVSADTRKPERWFQILVVQELRFSRTSTAYWKEFVDEEQKRAVHYWSGARGWVDTDAPTLGYLRDRGLWLRARCFDCDREKDLNLVQLCEKFGGRLRVFDATKKAACRARDATGHKVSLAVIF
jgi:hypothetical protein